MRIKYQETNPFPRGSEWRKWDLHVHAPGGKLNDNYGSSEEAMGRFCSYLAESDVEAFGIADYFSASTYFRCRAELEAHHAERHKVVFPNIELRLNESVNREDETVELHILLRHDVDEDRVNKLLSTLETEVKEEGRDRRLSCTELETTVQFERATVTRESIATALEKTFGKDQIEDPRDYMLIVPANHGGLRSDLSEARKSQLADMIDELAHGFFGKEGNVEHYLNPHRAKGGMTLHPKPVFAGSDAHSFEDLEAWLGRAVKEGPALKSVTWVKADPNFEGLLQTRAEPQGRVRITANRPDKKDPYRVLESVSFSNTDAFPARVVLNSNLVAVIGPRSSGKSSMLAHIAHAIDPEETERRQREVEPHRSDAELGPAPGVKWSEAADIGVEVKWVEPRTDRGRVIYVPQNALYAISQRPGEITRRIEPTVRGMDEQFDVAMRQMEGALEAAREQVDSGVADWFRVSEAIASAEEELLDRGDRGAIEATREELGNLIAAKREESALEDSEAELYEKVMDELSEIEARLAVVEAETRDLRPHLERSGDQVHAMPAPTVEVRVSPTPSELPEELRRTVLTITGRVEEATAREVAKALVDYQMGLDKEAEELRGRDKERRAEHAELIKKNEMNSEIEELTTARRRQDELLGQIEADEKRIKGLGEEKTEVGVRVTGLIAAREAAIEELLSVFYLEPRRRDPMVFGLEKKFDPDELGELAEGFNRGTNGPLMDAGQPLPIEKCASDPVAFMEALYSEEQKLKRGYEPPEVAAAVLGTSPKLLFWAEIEGDRIGGFETSSMSPGKQALFALSLILDDTDESWPLLVDQPEDDLDSRSIATQLVGYLITRKSERQIIMVSHDANLVIGADAEQVIVANRHGANTKNAGERTFDYFSGSLEHTRERREVELELECGGIREHACDILDGGEEAFRKRRRKYKIT